MNERKDLRLRFWALCQYLYDLCINFREADCGEIRKELFRDAVRGGHLNRLCFVSMETDFPMLRNPHTLMHEGVVLGFAKAHLAHYLSIGRRRSGFLKGYLLAQRRHLEACERCKKHVLAAVREDVELGNSVRKILGTEGHARPPRTVH